MFPCFLRPGARSRQLLSSRNWWSSGTTCVWLQCEFPCMETWPDSWLLQKAWWRWHFYNASIQRLPGLSIAKVLRICQKGEIRVGFNPCAKVLPMLCQASIRSRLSKGYLDHDICRWKNGRQFNATGMCTVHSAAYVHIQMLDVSLSLPRIGSSWVSDILRRFLLFDSPISPKPKGLRHPNVAWFLKPPVKNVVGVLENGSCTWTDCL